MTQQAQDGAELNDFGYKQELERSLGNFHTFAAGISYISILTGTFQLFYLGFALGGPAYWWSWPMVFVGQLMVALCFAELAAHYPVAGSIYNWSKKLSNPHVSWLAGWMMLTASIVTIAAVALAYQLTLPQIWTRLPDRRRRRRQVRLRRQRRAARHGPHHLHDGGQRLRREADGADQQRRRGHRARRRRAADHRVLHRGQARPGRRPRDPGPRRRAKPRLSRGVPRRLAGLRVRDVRVRHGQLARRGVGQPAPQRAARDPPRADRVVLHRRPDPARRDDGRRQHQRRAAEHGRPAVRRPRRPRRHRRQDLPDLRGDRHHRVQPRGPHRGDPDDVRDGAGQQPACRRAPRTRRPEAQDPGHPRGRDRPARGAHPGREHPPATDLLGDHQRSGSS